MILPNRFYNRARTGIKGLIWVFFVLAWPLQSAAEPRHGLAMHGEPRYPADFTHLAYAEPAAPKGGRLALAAQGSFDSLNPLIVKGAAAAGIRDHVYESLLARAADEPFSLYGLLAATVETPADRSWVAFTLRPEARFSDGRPVTIEDVIASHALLRDHGRPNHRFYYSKVEMVERLGERTVRFVFRPDGDREMPLIMGLMPVLPAHLVSAQTFERTTLEPPVGSGPYVVAKVEPGSRIVYRRDPDYWGRELPVNRGRYNFDEIAYEYFRDATAMFEAFKKGLYHVRSEDDPGRWAQAYDFPAVADGRVLKKEFELGTPAGMSALVFNTRRPFFSDIRVREALIRMFDFEWINANLYHGLYERTQSFFERSELSSHGRPADARERALLEPFPEAVKPAILDGTYRLPSGDGSGRDRRGRHQALALLADAGYVLKGGKLTDARTGTPVTFEMMTATQAQERLLLSYARFLRQIGIEVTLRQVDSAQYQRRLQTFDFDMIQYSWPASLSPGNEQSFRWSSEAARTEGSFNFPGVENPAVDAMIAALLAEETREGFVSAVRALDRVLLSGSYVLPLYHLPRQWVAHWRQLRHPDAIALDGIRLDTWWSATAD